MTLRRRALLREACASLLLAGIAWTTPAHAGSYLNRAALLISQARKESDFLRARFADKELARLIHRMCKVRLEVAGEMLVPKEVVQAHPHLLLVFENYERGAEAAENSQAERFLIYSQRAHDEERTFRAVLRQFGWELPAVDRRAD